MSRDPGRPGGTNQQSISLRALQVFAELTGCDAKRNGIPRSSVEQPTRRNARRNEQGQLLDVGIRCDSGRPEDAESAVAAGRAEWDEHLVEKPIKTPASALPGAGLKICELGMVVPGAHLLIAQTLAVTGQSVDLVTGLADQEEWPVQ